MIPQITEIGFPSYATLHQANISLSEMGSRIITTQVRIDGDITPDFSGWELEFKGERFVLPIRVPQATKDNSTRNGIVDLTFYSWAEDQLKRYFFMSLSEVKTGVAIADQYVASVTMPVEQFVTLFNSVLQYYFGDRIRMDLFQMGQGIYSTNPVIVEINYTHIWDVLTKFYETFSLRWNIEYDSTTSAYVIKVNYPSDAIEDHDFEYGYKGGLLKFERQVQDDGITNILLGRGGEKNLPYRYFKRTDQQNPEWQADPDAVCELRNIYFDRLRDINFRWYVRGWMQNPNRDRTWENQGYTYPTYSSVPAEYQFAYDRGLTDAKFNPVEFVRDTESIAKYGERWGALDDNDDIYPTIQGVERDPIGRVDEVVAVSEILTDDIEEAAAGNATTNSIGGALSVTINMAPHSRADHEFRSENFTVPEGKTANLNLTWLCLVNGASLAGVRVDTDHSEFVAIDANTGQRVSSEGLPAGTYYVSVEVRVYNDLSTTQTVTFGVNSLTATLADSVVEGWKPTFDIWVKNIWNTTKEAGESDAQYAARVWEPILGDRVGNEAKIVFSDGFMALSQDYEFVIVSYPVFDQSKMIGDVPSEWRITLRKSDAEFDATGLYIPNSQSGGKPVAGDHFFFTGIDMPFIYVQWAEQNLNAVKTTELEKLSDISPTWVITLDKVRVHTLEDEDYGTLLADRLSAGCTVRTKDSRFTNGDVLTLYVQTITYNWEEPSDDQPYLVPDINVVLSDKVVSVESSVQKIQGDIEVIRSTYAKTSDIESVVRRVASPLFLKKTGESDSSNSPTTFASKLSSKSFVQGDIGGSGWGHYDDDEGDAVLELDKVVVRKELRVNSLVVNQIAYVGGKQIMSAAAIECNQVVEDANGYTCFFDQKQGSVANLFVVGDIALGQMFDEENAETRYYCAEVTAVGDNYIVLSKTAKDGSGVPQKGDVIVQYGNKTQTSRQYVIIRDVIGGGYERMLSGLNSVTATGDEYYYAGRQSGQTPRWFVGNASGEHAEYQNGQLNIVGRLSVRKSDGTYQSMSAYIDTVNSVTQNLQDQIDGQIQSWAGDVAPLPDEDGGTANYPANAWSDDATRLKHMGDIYVNNTTGQGYRYTRAANDGDFYWVRITDEEVAEAITKANQALTQIQGYQYLKTALADGSTIVEGGLVLTNLIQLGKEESGQFQVYSGINGLMDTTAKGNGIAAWYGGPMGDKEDGAVSWAKSLFRFDGSGYLASGNIGWNADGSGHIPGITWNGNNITIAGDVQLGSVSGDTVTSMINLLRQINEWFGEDSDGNIYVKSNKGFYSNSFISAFGQSDTGGGGGIDLSAMWTNLQINESGVTGYGLQIDYHHLPTIAYNGNSGFVTSAAWSKTGSTNYLTLIRRALTASDIPSLTTSKISDLETWIDGKDFLTGNETITLSGVVSGSGTTTITTAIADGTITNAMLANSAITINGSSTALGGSFNTASITAGTAGTSSATSGLSIAVPYVTLNQYGIVTAYGTHTHSISKANITSAIGSTTYAPYNSAGYLPLNGGVMTGPISGVTYLSVNRAAQTTYRLDVNGTSRLAGNTSVTGTLTVGTSSANKATTLNGTLSVLGAATFSGASTFNDNVTVDSSSSITLGNGVLTWDAQNSAWKLTGNLYATGFVSAFGASDTGGGGGGGIDLSAMWTNLQINESGVTGYGLQIDYHHLPTIAYNGNSGFVTSAAWSKTGSTNYLTLTRRALTASDIPSLTTSKISDLETWIDGKDFLTGNETITLSGVVSGSGTTAITTSIADGKITNAMLAGSIANGKLANSAITINGSSTALGGSFATADITAGTAGTSSATSGLSIAIPYVTLNKYGIVTAYGTHTHSISKANITSAIGSTTYAPYNSAGYLPLSGGTMTGDIKMTAGKYITTTDGSTIIGVTTQGVFYIGEPQGGWSTNIAGEGDLLHDTGGSLAVILDQENFGTYALPLAGGVMTGPISGVTYLSVNRAAQTTYRLDVNGTSRLAGNTSVTGTLTVGTTSANKETTLNGTLSVLGAATFSGGVTVDSTTSIKLGGGVLTWDAQNSAWKLTGNLYATGFISAFGASETGGGGGGIDLSAMWANLQVNESGTTGYNLQINPGHLTTALGTYVNAITTTGSGNAITAVSKSGSTLTFTKGSTFALASRTVKGTGYLTGGGALSANRTIDIASTYKGYIDEGHTAYGWGDHSQAGYLTGITSSMVTTALGFTPANSTALGNYLPLAGGTMAGSIIFDGGVPHIKFNVDASQAKGIAWLNTSDTTVGQILMHNTAKSIYINATGASDIFNDAVGKYSLKIGQDKLTYNTYSIYHTNNLTKSVVTGLIGSTTYAPYNADGYLPLSGGTMTNTTVVGSLNADLLDGQHGSYYATASSLGNYLPLAGGTMTGDLNLKYGSNLYVKFDVDTSRVRNGLIFLDTSGTTIGRLTMHNTAKAIYINATGAASINADAVGKYSLKIGEDSLTYNTYDIYHTNNLTKSVVTGLIGSTTYAPYNADGYLPLSGGTMTGNLTAPKFIKTDGTSSQFLKADGSVDSNTYMTTDTAQTITGAKTFADAGTALLGADQYAQNSNISYAYPATAWNAWHDHFAFLRNHTIRDVQVTTDGSTWTASSTDLKPLFIHKENTFVQILDAADRAFRFTLYSSGSFHTCQIYWLSFGTGYSNPFSSFTLTAECSADNSTWTTWGEHTVTAGTTSYCMKVKALPANQKYLRFTFTKTGNLTTGKVRLCAFSGLTFRKGDQGLGKENSYPFSWDTGVNLLPLYAGVSTLGTESYKWNTVYGVTGNFSGSTTSKLMYFRQASATSNAGYIGLGSSSNDISLVNYGANSLLFWTNSGLRMKIDSRGNVGIGTTSPATKLQVNADNNVWTSFTGSSIVFRKLSTYTTGYNNTIRFEQVDSSGTVTATKPLLGAYSSTIYQFMYLGGSQTDATVRITATGVGIKKGNASPSYALDVTGVIHSTTGIFSDGYVSAFGQSTTSDARLKKDFLDTTLTVDNIAHAPAITFLWKDREGKRQAGSLAQYWETVLPEVVTDIEGKKGLDYGAAALVSAITIARDVNDHEKRIRELERENRELKRKLGYADR